MLTAKSNAPRLSLRTRKWLTAAIVVAVASFAPVMLLLGQTRYQRGELSVRKALAFEPDLWAADTGKRDVESPRGLMVPGLLTTGRLAGMAEADIRTLLGEPDCSPTASGPFAADRRLVYWVGRVGTARVKPDDPAAGPGCLYLRLVDGRVVEWQIAAAPAEGIGRSQ